LKAPLLLSSLVLPLGDDASPETREVAATDGGDDAWIERGPAIEAVEDARIGGGVFQKLGHCLAGRAGSAPVNMLDETLQTGIGAEAVGDRAFQNERLAGAA
jgi:hypothetical protein